MSSSFDTTIILSPVNEAPVSDMTINSPAVQISVLRAITKPSPRKVPGSRVKSAAEAQTELEKAEHEHIPSIHICL